MKINAFGAVLTLSNEECEALLRREEAIERLLLENPSIASTIDEKGQMVNRQVVDGIKKLLGK